MTGSEFTQTYAGKGPIAWEAAAFEIARQGQQTPRAWVPIQLADAAGNTATLNVQSDVFAIGPASDSLRLPMTPHAAQDIGNLNGWLLPTPWLVYQMWRQAPIKLAPQSATQIGDPKNLGTNLLQFAKHSAVIDRQIAGVLASTDRRTPGPELVAGQKKHVIVSNIYVPHKVLIFGWYKPSPDIFDNGLAMTDPERQPIQPKSNVHGEDYWDYSHGIQYVHPVALVNGHPMLTQDLYAHPTLSKLVSSEGPLKTVRYPSRVPVNNPPVGDAVTAASVIAAAPMTSRPPGSFRIVHEYPSTIDLAFQALRGKG